MTRRNQPEYEVLLQKAYWFLMRLWEVEQRKKFIYFHFNIKKNIFLQRGLSDSTEITKDAELEAAAEAAAGGDTGKKQQKGVSESVAKKKPPLVPTGKSMDKQVTVSIL